MTDTSDEAIERATETLLGWLTGPDSGQNDGIVETCALLRALRDERAALRAERDAANERAHLTEVMIAARGTNRDYQQARAEKAEAERDAARASAARMREGITKAILEIEDAGPKAMKYAVQDLQAALKEPSHD